LFGPSLSAVRQRWMIANGLPCTAQHSTAGVHRIEWTKALSSGRLAFAALRLPTEMALAQIVLGQQQERPALPGKALLTWPVAATWQSFSAVDV